MKKIITLVAAMAFATTTFSQWSINAGGNVSQFTGKDAQGGTKFGYQFGFTTYSTKLFSVQPGLFLIGKGGKYANNNISLNYLQIPVNLMLGYNVNEELRIVAGAGLYGSIGLWGKKGNDKINFFDVTDRFKALDFGWQFVIGAQWGRYGLRLNYQPALIGVRGSWDTGKSDFSGSRYKAFNNSFTFGVSYTFGDLEGTPPPPRR